MPNYSVSTIDRIGDITRGIHVQTGVLTNTVVLDSTAAAGLYALFNVFGRIRILGLNCEAITAFSAHGTTIKWTFESTTPIVGDEDICGASGAMTSAAIGSRCQWVGPALNTAAVASVKQMNIGGVVTNWMDVGQSQGIGVINSVAGTAAQASGTCQYNLYYLPISEGAYVTKIV